MYKKLQLCYSKIHTSLEIVIKVTRMHAVCCRHQRYLYAIIAVTSCLVRFVKESKRFRKTFAFAKLRIVKWSHQSSHKSQQWRAPSRPRGGAQAERRSAARWHPRCRARRGRHQQASRSRTATAQAPWRCARSAATRRARSCSSARRRSSASCARS